MQAPLLRHTESPHAFDSVHDTLPNKVGTVIIKNIPIVSLLIDGVERLCLAQISNTLLRDFTYNEIHNRRVALGITCIQCTPVQLEILRRAGAMPVSSRRCGMITKREAERLVKSFLEEAIPPQLPDNFNFDVYHECGWGCQGKFVPSRYNSSRAKCIKCVFCSIFFSPNKFIFHCHKLPTSLYHHPDAANFNSWRRHLKLLNTSPDEELVFAWEDVKAMFNGGSRRKVMDTVKDMPTTEIKIPREKTPTIENVQYSQSFQSTPFSNSNMMTPTPFDLFRHFPMRPMVSPLPETDWTKYTELLRMRAMVGQYSNLWPPGNSFQPEICYPSSVKSEPSILTNKKTESSPTQLWRGFLDDDDQKAKRSHSPAKVTEIEDTLKPSDEHPEHRDEFSEHQIDQHQLHQQMYPGLSKLSGERCSRKSKPRKYDLSCVDEKRAKFDDDDDELDVELHTSNRDLDLMKSD